jgi:hypothetical protein
VSHHHGFTMWTNLSDFSASFCATFSLRKLLSITYSIVVNSVPTHLGSFAANHPKDRFSISNSAHSPVRHLPDISAKVSPHHHSLHPPYIHQARSIHWVQLHLPPRNPRLRVGCIVFMATNLDRRQWQSPISLMLSLRTATPPRPASSSLETRLHFSSPSLSFATSQLSHSPLWVFAALS